MRNPPPSRFTRAIRVLRAWLKVRLMSRQQLASLPAEATWDEIKFAAARASRLGVRRVSTHPFSRSEMWARIRQAGIDRTHNDEGIRDYALLRGLSSKDETP